MIRLFHSFENVATAGVVILNTFQYVTIINVIFDSFKYHFRVGVLYNDTFVILFILFIYLLKNSFGSVVFDYYTIFIN